MSLIAYQITGVAIVCTSVCLGADQRKHQSSPPLALLRWIHRWPVDSPYKGPVARKMFPFDEVIVDNMCVCEHTPLFGLSWTLREPMRTWVIQGYPINLMKWSYCRYVSSRAGWWSCKSHWSNSAYTSLTKWGQKQMSMNAQTIFFNWTLLKYNTHFTQICSHGQRIRRYWFR